MIQVTMVSESRDAESGDWFGETVTLATDEGYNPTVLRDLRDAAVKLIRERTEPVDDEVDLDDGEGDDL